MRKTYYFMVLVIFLAFLFVGCGEETEVSGEGEDQESNTNSGEDAKQGDILERVEETGVLRVGFEGTYPPFNYQGDTEDFVGFDVDISKEVAKRLGVEVEFLTSKWAGLIGGLNADKFDVIIAQMTVTEERKESVDFTDPYVITGAVIVTHNDTDGIESLADLNGLKVGAAAGTSFADLAEQAEGADVKLYEGGFSTYVNDVVNKRLDALVNDSLVMGYNIEESGLPIKVTSELLSRDANAMAVKKDNEDFVNKMNELLAEMKEDGTYEEIYMKWFGMKPLE
ncbi:transporter substrate-binding domain-containing protein [Oceanobacillus sp. CF4.6]|uniref:transporter substrate-binding domain-containing protein n=1 Tax=Oceanobacillus sp. CF4.6 TaxID=3373080 RepID=UPI003EE5CE2C